MAQAVAAMWTAFRSKRYVGKGILVVEGDSTLLQPQKKKVCTDKKCNQLFRILTDFCHMRTVTLAPSAYSSTFAIWGEVNFSHLLIFISNFFSLFFIYLTSWD